MILNEEFLSIYEELSGINNELEEKFAVSVERFRIPD